MTSPGVEPISAEAVTQLVAGARIVGTVVKGGQKAVVPIELAGETLALKILFLGPREAEKSDSGVAASAPPFEEARERVRREVSILSTVRIPQLARTGPVSLSEGEISGSRVLYYSEEWIYGRDLAKTIGEGPRLPPSDIIRLGIDISAAIAWLWEHSKVHRDIKPANIMRRADGTYVLLDLGYALDLRDRSLTASGFAVGTPRYFSPEHLDTLKKRNMDFRSDLYCLGVTMYEAATGLHPYYRAGMDDAAILDCVLNKIPPTPSELIVGFPVALSEIILRMLAKYPHLRYQSCSKLQVALNSVDLISGSPQ